MQGHCSHSLRANSPLRVASKASCERTRMQASSLSCICFHVLLARDFSRYPTNGELARDLFSRFYYYIEESFHFSLHLVDIIWLKSMSYDSADCIYYHAKSTSIQITVTCIAIMKTVTASHVKQNTSQLQAIFINVHLKYPPNHNRNQKQLHIYSTK